MQKVALDGVSGHFHAPAVLPRGNPLYPLDRRLGGNIPHTLKFAKRSLGTIATGLYPQCIPEHRTVIKTRYVMTQHVYMQ
jgi:hypothetical protein